MDLGDWLQKLGLGQYAERFAENEIGVAVLSDLTDQDLKEIGVSALGHRRVLLRAIAAPGSVETDGAKPSATHGQWNRQISRRHPRRHP